MATYLNDDAICLRVTDFSETSQIVGLFTRHHGLVPLIAKGSKRQSQKGHTGTISGPLDLLTAGEVVFIPARGAAELGTLAAWELTDHRTGLRTSLAALNAAMLCAELTLLLQHPHDPHEPLFVELDATLTLLATSQRMRATVAYAKAALSAAGYAPHLETCVACGSAIPAGMDHPVRFSPVAGGLLCGRAECRAAGTTLSVPRKIALALERLPAPRALLESPPDRAADPVALRTALGLLLAQIETITDRPIKTRSLLPTIFA